MRTVRASALNADINVTPLVDVCLVLLIIFMVVTPLMVTGLPVALPKAASGEAIGQGPLQITINADGTLYVGHAALRREELTAHLERIRASSAARPVVVQGDKSLRYAEIVSVLAACREAGFEDVGLAVERPD
jgi:biopolymer transport protein TolR